ncbi:YjjG family noncanonical pyrimidine nucleotidase [Sungkyunkwania multivorans]|uniref:YjjG family noncanonical pyrimidine nucleotidase n=1 Tax=Sungkyunkwania multivorans TaxID=1173618 RepID=A0ABW3CUB2_9FLAO
MRDFVTDIFFDLDHTLWDFEKNSALTFKKILEQHRIAVELSAFLEVYIPTNHAYWKLYREERVTKQELRYGRLRNTFDCLKVQVEEEMIHTLSEEYIANLTTYNHLFDDVHEVLTYLNESYRLHIITNGFQEVQQGKLHRSGIAKFFDQVIDSEMVGVKKPNPRIFQFALAKATTHPDTSLMIGDSLEADVLGAQSVGMHAIHFNSHNEDRHKHCTIINRLAELKDHL